jgi:hypothetical protein
MCPGPPKDGNVLTLLEPVKNDEDEQLEMFGD